MIDATRTTTVLLEGLFDPSNDAVWSEFDARYRPLVIAFARRLGLSDADAADVAQETLVQFLAEYQAGKYDRGRGRLRSWLIGIARFRAAAVFRARARKRETAGASAVIDLEDEAQMTRIWESERRALLLREALDDLRTRTRTGEDTIRAFELFVVRQMPAAQVAAELGVSVQEVYVAKSRVAARLRDIIDRLERAFEGETDD